MNKKILFALMLLSFAFYSAKATEGLHHITSSGVWKISYIEVEDYLYPDTSLGQGTYFQLFENGRCVIRTIEFEGFDSQEPIENIDLTQGVRTQEATTYIYNLSDSTLTINPTAPEKWVWKIKQVTEDKIIFTSNITVEDETYLYTFTLIQAEEFLSLE